MGRLGSSAPRWKLLVLPVIAAFIFAACGGPGESPAASPIPTEEPTDGATEQTDEPQASGCDSLPEPEITSIEYGHRLPGLNSIAPLLVAAEEAFFANAGFESYELVTTESVSAGLVSGSLDYGADVTLDLVHAPQENIPTRIISAYRNFNVDKIAVHSDFSSVEELAGQDVLLGGTPGTLDYDKRANLMAEAGWDLTGIPVNPVTIPGGSDAWVELFLEGQLAVTPIFNRHQARVLEAGHQLVVDERTFGNDMLAATTDQLEQYPNATARFLCAFIEAAQFWQDHDNKETILAIGEQRGINIDDNVRDAYELDILQYNGEELFDGGFELDQLEAFYEENVGGSVDLSEVLWLEPLHAAQDALGLERRPVLP